MADNLMLIDHIFFVNDIPEDKNLQNKSWF